MGSTADAKIKNFLKKVRKNFNVEKALLFGSRARGDFLEDSDYDIIIVSPDFENVFFTKRVVALSEFWDYLPITIDILCYTPKEFEKMKKRIGIVQQALEQGIDL